MRARILILTLAILLSPLLSAAVAGEPTLKDVKKQIAAKLKKIKTLQLSIRIEENRKYEMNDLQYRREKTTTGELMLERRDQTFVSRYHWKSRTKDYEGDEPDPHDNSFEAIQITDDSHSYESSRKHDLAPWRHTKGKRSFRLNPLDLKSRYSKDEFEQKLLPVEELEGAKAWVIEMIPKKEKTLQRDPAKTRVWFDQKTGVEIKNVDYDDTGKVQETRIFRDIRINEEIDPGRFKFEPPEGENVVDMTGF
ncbi:MAG TPA: hypothetical protein P5081_00600 [Phycisphaerae bacterium]|nr:hypothetical protein [Phycisphaerae bacterium]HRW51353.1 hypothetical protein [Phycisphaerae bacterium]